MGCEIGCPRGTTAPTHLSYGFAAQATGELFAIDTDAPVWMLNYNGEAHGLRNYENKRDFAIRMQQFFDHYLKGAPAPVWMERGIPAVLKGKTLGLETEGAGNL